MENIKIIFAVLAVKVLTGFIKFLKFLFPICAIATFITYLVLCVYAEMDLPNLQQPSPDSPLNEWVAYKTIVDYDGEVLSNT